MTRDKVAVELGLLAKGFVQNQSHHHQYVYWTTEGKKSSARTRTSHTRKPKTLDDYLLGCMARQCKLTKPQFLDLVDCPMNRDEYEKLLKEQGEI
jgi:hypothetical protein